MARSVTLLTLVTRVRQRSDNVSAIVRHPDQKIVDHINESIAELVDVIRGVFGQDYFRASATFSTLNGISTYPLQADFLALISCDIVISGNLVVTARPYMENERNLFKFYPAAWVYNQPIFYRLTGQNINFIPTPQGGYSVTLNYQPVSVYFTPTFNGAGQITAGGSATLDGIGGWEEYAVLDAAIKLLIEDQETDIVPTLEGRKLELRMRIEALAPQHDAGQNERVQDVYRNQSWGWGDGWGGVR